MAETERAQRLLVVWLVSILVLTLSPITLLRAAPVGFAWITPAAARLGPFDFVANILAFVPLGVFGVAAGLRRRLVITIGALLTFFIECAQTYLVVRYPSNFDLVANASGTAIGALLAAPLLDLGVRIYGRPVRALLLVVGGAAAFWLASNVPQVRLFGAALPFSVGVLAGLVACGLWRPRLAFLLACGATLLVCAPLSLYAAFAVPGVALGVWPYMGTPILVPEHRLA